MSQKILAFMKIYMIKIKKKILILIMKIMMAQKTNYIIEKRIIIIQLKLFLLFRLKEILLKIILTII